MAGRPRASWLRPYTSKTFPGLPKPPAASPHSQKTTPDPGRRISRSFHVYSSRSDGNPGINVPTSRALSKWCLFKQSRPQYAPRTLFPANPAKKPRFPPYDSSTTRERLFIWCSCTSVKSFYPCEIYDRSDLTYARREWGKCSTPFQISLLLVFYLPYFRVLFPFMEFTNAP